MARRVSRRRRLTRLLSATARTAPVHILRAGPGPGGNGLVAEFGAAAGDVLRQLGLDRVVQRGLLVPFQGLRADLARPRGGVQAAEAEPALVVGGRGQQ